MSDVVRVLIVDDEPHARAGTRIMVERAGDMVVAGEAEDGPSALRAIRTLEPDLVLLDVQMPGMSGIQVAASLAGVARLPLIVFITAFDSFAVDAFEIDALDYIVKPFTDSRFDQMLNRARTTIRSRSVTQLGDRLLKLAERAGLVNDTPERNTDSPYIEKLTFRDGGRTVVVPQKDILWVEAASYYARVHTESASFLIRESLSSLEDRLDPAIFMRVHRGAIIRLPAVDEIEDGETGVFAVLRGGKRAPVTRTRLTSLRKALRP